MAVYNSLPEAVLAKILGNRGTSKSVATEAEQALEIARRAAQEAEAKRLVEKMQADAIARAESMTPSWAKEEIASLREMLKHPSAVNNPADAAKVWDDIYNKIASNIQVNGRSVGPRAGMISYKMPDGKIVSRRPSEPPPEGGTRLNLTDVELQAIMPKRPTPPVKEPVEPNGYNNPPPPGYGQAQPRPEPPPGASAPPPPPPPGGPSADTVNMARETIAGAERPPRGPWDRPSSGVPNMPMPKAPYVGKEPNMAGWGAVAASPAVAASIAAGYAPEETMDFVSRAWHGKGPVRISPSDSSPNPDNLPYMGPGVSHSPDDFRSDNVDGSGHVLGDYFPNSVAERSSPLPDWRGQPKPEPQTTASTVSTARQVIQRAQNSPAAQTQRAVAQAATQAAPQPEQSQPQVGAFTRLIRGDWTEGSDQRIAEAMRRQKEESGVDSSMARGGAAQKQNKVSKDDVLHKALDIIHTLMVRR